MANEALSVVIPTRDRSRLLDGCLAALGAVVRSAGPFRSVAEVIVVDSASRDANRVAALVEHHGARYVRCERPGASRARNAGWRAAGGELIAFVDDDVRVAPGWADAVTLAFDAHPEAAFVTGRITPPPGQESVDRPVAVMDRTTAAPITMWSDTPLGHGANMAIRRPRLAELGGFDERLGAGSALRAAEDNDLFDRALAAGMVGWYEPAAAAWHLQWRGKRELLALDWSYGIGGGARLAKLARADRSRARKAARTYLWDWGLVPLGRDVRAGYEFGALGTAGRLAGVAVGFVAGLTMLREGGRSGTPPPVPGPRRPGSVRPAHPPARPDRV